MKLKLALAIIIVSMGSLPGSAQMDVNSANYFINPMVLNPAYAGKFRNQSLMLDVRKDAAGIDGSPTSQYLTYDWGIEPEKVGIGLMAKNDVEGLLRHHMAYAIFSYRAKIDEGHYFDMGVNAGLIYRGINFDGIRAKDPTESILNSENKYSSSFDGGAGLIYHFKGIEAGLSVNHLFEPGFSFTNTLDQVNLQSTLLRQYLVTLGYNWEINETYELKPLVVLRSGHGSPFKFEGGLAAWWKNTLWLGLMYKQDLGVNALAGLELYDRVSFAYSFHYYTGALASVTQGAHELILGLRLGKAKDPVRDSQMDELIRQNAELYEQLEILKQENEARKNEIDDLQQGYSQVEKDSMKAIIAGLKELHDHYDDHKEHIVNEQDVHQIHVDSVHHESEDLDAKYRVIIGSFNEMGHAASMQKILLREYGLNSQIMKNESSGRYLIYSKECDHRDDCKTELQKVKGLNTKGVIRGEPWLFKSQQ